MSSSEQPPDFTHPLSEGAVCSNRVALLNQELSGLTANNETAMEAIIMGTGTKARVVPICEAFELEFEVGETILPLRSALVTYEADDRFHLALQIGDFALPFLTNQPRNMGQCDFAFAPQILNGLGLSSTAPTTTADCEGQLFALNDKGEPQPVARLFDSLLRLINSEYQKNDGSQHADDYYYSMDEIAGLLNLKEILEGTELTEFLADLLENSHLPRDIDSELDLPTNVVDARQRAYAAYLGKSPDEFDRVIYIKKTDSNSVGPNSAGLELQLIRSDGITKILGKSITHTTDSGSMVWGFVDDNGVFTPIQVDPLETVRVTTREQIDFIQAQIDEELDVKMLIPEPEINKRRGTADTVRMRNYLKSASEQIKQIPPGIRVVLDLRKLFDPILMDYGPVSTLNDFFGFSIEKSGNKKPKFVDNSSQSLFDYKDPRLLIVYNRPAIASFRLPANYSGELHVRCTFLDKLAPRGTTWPFTTREGLVIRAGFEETVFTSIDSGEQEPEAKQDTSTTIVIDIDEVKDGSNISRGTGPVIEVVGDERESDMRKYGLAPNSPRFFVELDPPNGGPVIISPRNKSAVAVDLRTLKVRKFPTLTMDSRSTDPTIRAISLYCETLRMLTSYGISSGDTFYSHSQKSNPVEVLNMPVTRAAASLVPAIVTRGVRLLRIKRALSALE